MCHIQGRSRKVCMWTEALLRNLHWRWGFPSYHGTSSLRFSWTAPLTTPPWKSLLLAPADGCLSLELSGPVFPCRFWQGSLGQKITFFNLFSIWPWRQSSFHQLVGSSFTRTTWRKDTRYPQFHGRTCVYLSYIMCLMMFSYVFVGSLLAQATFDTLVCSSRPNFSAQVAGLTTPQHPDGYLSIYLSTVIQLSRNASLFWDCPRSQDITFLWQIKTDGRRTTFLQGKTIL